MGRALCDQAACAPKLCEAFDHICVDGDVHECDALGTTTHVYVDCPEPTTCAVLAPQVLDCRSPSCAANATVCLGNALGKCAADGASLSQVDSNCANANQVCNKTPACIASAVDTLGAMEQVELVGSDQVMGNIIDVHSNRRLTKLEANLLLEAPRDLRWVVFEQTDAQYELVCSEITPNKSGSALFGSDQLSCDLVAGKRYLLGVAFVVGEGYHYYDVPPWTGVLSFGNVVGNALGSYSTSDASFFPFTNLYRQLITTELP